jgi:hypothetical protein
LGSSETELPRAMESPHNSFYVHIQAYVAERNEQYLWPISFRPQSFLYLCQELLLN